MIDSFPCAVHRPCFLTFAMRRWNRRMTFLAVAMSVLIFIDLQFVYHYDNTLLDTTKQNSRSYFVDFESAFQHRFLTPPLIEVHKFPNRSRINNYINSDLESKGVSRSGQIQGPGRQTFKPVIYRSNKTKYDELKRDWFFFNSLLDVMKPGSDEALSNSSQSEQSSIVNRMNDRKRGGKFGYVGSRAVSTSTLKNVLPHIDMSNASVTTLSKRTYKHFQKDIVSNADMKSVSTQIYKNVLSMNAKFVPDINLSNASIKNVLPENEIFPHRVVGPKTVNTSKISPNPAISLVSGKSNVPNIKQKMSSANISKDGGFNTYHNKTPLFMGVQGNGRLGNNIFQFGALIGISRYHGYTPQLSRNHKLRQIFKINLPVIQLKNQHKYIEKHAGIFDPSVLSLNRSVNWTLNGYYQSWKYFLNSTSQIRDQLRFKDKILAEMLKALPEFIKNRTTVGVHVRRGDMNTRYELKRGYSIATKSYIKNAMQYYREEYLNPVFIICSDEILWCKKHLGSTDTVFVHGSAEVDLATLAHCTHSIITSGTYGWWGAFLAGGETVYYKNYPRQNSWLDSQYRRDNYYLPHWRAME